MLFHHYSLIFDSYCLCSLAFTCFLSLVFVRTLRTSHVSNCESYEALDSRCGQNSLLAYMQCLNHFVMYRSWISCEWVQPNATWSLTPQHHLIQHSGTVWILRGFGFCKEGSEIYCENRAARTATLQLELCIWLPDIMLSDQIVPCGSAGSTQCLQLSQSRIHTSDHANFSLGIFISTLFFCSIQRFFKTQRAVCTHRNQSARWHNNGC